MASAGFSIHKAAGRGRPHELGLTFLDVLPGWAVEVWLNGESGVTVLCELHITRQPVGEGTTEPPARAEGTPHLDLAALRLHAMQVARQVVNQGLHAPPQYRLPEYENAKRILRWSRRQASIRTEGGRLRRDRTWRAMFAGHYVQLAAEHTAVIPLLAETYHYSPETVRDIIKQCRSEGLLTRPPGRGKVGGQLTPLAMRLIEGGTTR